MNQSVNVWSTHLNGKDEPLFHLVVESASETDESLACLGTDLEAVPSVARDNGVTHARVLILVQRDDLEKGRRWLKMDEDGIKMDEDGYSDYSAVSWPECLVIKVRKVDFYTEMDKIRLSKSFYAKLYKVFQYLFTPNALFSTLYRQKLVKIHYCGECRVF